MDNNGQFEIKRPSYMIQGYPHGMGFYYFPSKYEEDQEVRLLKYGRMTVDFRKVTECNSKSFQMIGHTKTVRMTMNLNTRYSR